MSVSGGGKAPLGFVVGRPLDKFDKEIARSVPVLSPVLATRQSPAELDAHRGSCSRSRELLSPC